MLSTEDLNLLTVLDLLSKAIENMAPPERALAELRIGLEALIDPKYKDNQVTKRTILINLINEKNSNGKTLLHVAAEFKKLDILDYLLSIEGSDPISYEISISQQNSDGKSFLDILYENKSISQLPNESQQIIKRTFIAFNPNDPETWGNSAVLAPALAAQVEQAMNALNITGAAVGGTSTTRSPGDAENPLVMPQ